MRYSYFVLIVLCCFGCSKKNNVPTSIELLDNWQFKAVTDSVLQTATVPGNVFSDLLDRNKMPNPFIGENEEKVQWVSNTDWEYKTSFQLDNETLNGRHVELNFKGLDTYATVFLNDNLILKSNNAFRQFSIDVKSILKKENELRIIFENTSKHEEQAKANLNYALPEGNRIFSRKAQFQYGWDWGPELNTSGIWRPIKLNIWDDFKIEDIYINQLQLTDRKAKLQIQLQSKTQLDKELTYNVYVNDSLFIEELETKNQKSEINFEINNPKRWWPHNLGEPYLYDIKVVVKDGKTVLDNISKKIGLRTIELVTKKDSDAQQSSSLH